MPIVAVMMVGIIAMAGFAIDVGNLERVRAQMQSAADAAATAGASSLIENQADTPAAKNAASVVKAAAAAVYPMGQFLLDAELIGGNAPSASPCH